MKRLISILLCTIILSGLVPNALAEDYSVGTAFWGDNLETYEYGATPYAFPNFYDSSAQKRSEDWTYVNDVKVERESELINNKVACFYNDTKEAKDSYLAKYTDVTTETGNAEFEISFRANPKKSNLYVTAQRYGGTGGTTKIFNLKSGALYYGEDVYITKLEMDKWFSAKIYINEPEQKISIYVDNQLVYYAPFSNGKATGYVIFFRSALSSGNVAYWDDFALKSAEMATEEKQTVGNNLDKYRGVHPRLFYDAEDFEELKIKSQTDLAEDFAAYIKNADILSAEGAVEYYEDPNLEELWMRSEGDEIRFLSFMYKLTGNAAYKEAAADRVEMAISYPHWGRGPDFENKNLACSHMLVGISCYYDWLFDELSENEKYAIKNIIIERATRLSGGAWWTRSYTMNHCWNGGSGSLTAAMAVYDEYEGALKWADEAHKWYVNIFKYLGEDGACHEGLMYWDYGLKFMKYYLQLAPKFYNIDYSKDLYVQNTAKYAEAMFLPKSADGDYFTTLKFSDYRVNFDATYFGSLAVVNAMTIDEEQRKINQWYLNKYRELYNKRIVDESFFVDYDPNAPFSNPEETGVSKETLFDDLGIFFSRTSWTDDDASLFAFRCGPTLGKNCQVGWTKGDLGTGHVHNDINSPLIYAYGENLLDEDDYGGKHATASHNTLLVNGLGQWGDGGWQDVAPRGVDANPHIVKSEEVDGLIYVVGDATEIYNPDTTKLKKFVRHFIYLKPEILLMVDEVETNSMDGEVPVELRFFPVVQDGNQMIDGSYSFKSRNVNYNINPIVLQDGVQSEFTAVNKVMSASSTISRNVVRVVTNNSKLIQPTAISWCKAGGEPVRVSASIDKNECKFYTDDSIITLDIENLSVSRKVIDSDIVVKTNNKIIELTNNPEMKNDRIFVPLDDVNAITDGEVIAECDENGNITLTKSYEKVLMALGSNQVTEKNVLNTMDVAPYKNGDVIMIPLRAMVQNFGIECVWKGDKRTVQLTTGVDYSDATLRSINVSGYSIAIQPGVYDYTLKILAESKNITPYASVETAKYEVIEDGEVFGKNEILVTALNGKTTAKYTVTIEPFYGIGNVPVYNLGYSTSDGNIGENVVDGDFSTRWSAQGDGQYLWFDLGKKIKVASLLVAFSSGDSRLGFFDIQISDDKENWTTVKECVSSGKTKEAEEYKLDNVETRYIRFLGHGAGQQPGSGWNSVSEMAVIAAE